jgi:hypothetical protein
VQDGKSQGGEEMIPTLILIVAVYVCFRFIEIGHRERRQGRWLIPILAAVCLHKCFSHLQHIEGGFGTLSVHQPFTICLTVLCNESCSFAMRRVNAVLRNWQL